MNSSGNHTGQVAQASIGGYKPIAAANLPAGNDPRQLGANPAAMACDRTAVSAGQARLPSCGAGGASAGCGAA